MTRRLSKTIKFLGLSLCFLVLILTLVFVGLNSYLTFFGPISLTGSKDQLMKEMHRNFPQYKLQIGSISLERSNFRGGWYKFGLVDFLAIDLQGRPIAHLPQVDIHFETLPLLLGKLKPSGIYLKKAKLQLAQNKKGLWSIPSLDKGDDTKNDASITTQAWLGEKLVGVQAFLAGQSSLKEIGIRSGTLILKGQNATEYWDVDTLSFQAQNGASGDVSGVGTAKRRNWDDKNIRFSISSETKRKALLVKMDVENLKPSEISMNMPILASLDSFSSQLSGQLFGEFDFNGQTKFFRTKIGLSPGSIYPKGAGKVSLPILGGSIDLEYQSELGQVKIHRADFAFPKGYASFQGVGRFYEETTSTPQAWDFDLALLQGHLGRPDQIDPMLPIDHMQLAGRYEPNSSNVLIKTLQLTAGKATIDMKQRIRKGKPILVGKFDNVDFRFIKRVWPDGYAAKTKLWLKTHAKQGKLRNGNVIIFDLAEETPKFLLRSDIKNVVINPITKWPDLKAPSMSLEIHNDRLTVKMAEAQLGDKKGSLSFIRNAKFEILNLLKKNNGSSLKFDIKGGMWPILDKLSLPLFNVDLKTYPMLLKMDGTVEGTVALEIPFGGSQPSPDIKIDGDFTLSDFKGHVDRFGLDEGAIKLNISEKALTIGGKIFLDKMPTKIRWQYIYDSKKGEVQPIHFQGQIPNGKVDAYHIDLSPMISSDVPVEVSINPFSKKRDRVYVKANLTDASFALRQLGWKKPAGLPSFVDFNIVPTDNGTQIENFKVRGDRLSALGELTLDKNGKLSRIEMSKVSYDLMSNFALKGARSKNGSWSYDLQGHNLDARPFFRSFLTGASRSKRNSKSQNISINGRFSKMLGENSVQINDVTFNFSKQNGRVNRMFMNGQFPSKRKLTGNLVAAQTKAPILEIATGDAGKALRMAGVYTGMVGGKGRLSLQFNPERSLTSMRGRLDVSRFGLRQDTVLTELVSPEDIRKNKLAQQGILPFDRLSMPFAIGQNQMVVHRSFVNGPALGATIQGTLDYARRKVQLSGTYVPLYGLNSILGNVPILGQLLVGRKDEGIVGITYGVVGSMNNPQVIVNPVSILAPGVLRQIFEFQQEKPRIKRRRKTIPSYEKRTAPR